MDNLTSVRSTFKDQLIITGRESAAVLGFTSAIGACGYLIPRSFGASIKATGGPHLALEIFLAFYLTCVTIT